MTTDVNEFESLMDSLLPHWKPGDGGAREVVLVLPRQRLSRLKFALEDIPTGAAGVPDLTSQQRALVQLRKAALDEDPLVTEDESIRWIEDILDQMTRVTGAAWRTSGDRIVALFTSIREGVVLGADERSQRFAKGGPLGLDQVYREFESLKESALEEGALGESAASALTGLRIALVELGAVEDKAGQYVRAYVVDLYHFLRDEDLLGTVTEADMAQINAFLE